MTSKNTSCDSMIFFNTSISSQVHLSPTSISYPTLCATSKTILVLWSHLGLRHSTSRSVTTMICIVPFTNSQWSHHFLLNTSSPSHRTRRRSAPRVTISAVTSRLVRASFPTACRETCKHVLLDQTRARGS